MDNVNDGKKVGRFLGKIGVVGSVEQVERMEVGGYREIDAGDYVHLIPQMSRGTLADFRFGSLPPVTGYEQEFGSFLVPGSSAWREYFSTRKVVERDAPGGGSLVSVTSNLHEIVDRRVLVDEPLEAGVKVLREPRTQKYQLTQVLTDPSIADKYDFDERFMGMVRSVAIAHPDKAAERLQEYMRRVGGSKTLTVYAGKYSRSRAWAKASVIQHASRFPIMTVAVDSNIIGDKMFVYGPLGEAGWHVLGPVKYACEIMLVHRMVMVSGTSSPMFALGAELGVLDIDISPGGSVYESPSRWYHAGPHDALPSGSSEETSVLLSTQGRAMLARMADAISVVKVDGVAVASAVQVSAKYSLVNSHVLDSGSTLTDATGILVPIKELSQDLWLVSSEKPHEFLWSLREPIIAESVVVVYQRQSDAGPVLQFSSPMTLRACDGNSLVMSMTADLQPGMSGGAIVALSDMALIGVYEGVGSRYAAGSVFSQEHYTDVCMMDHVSNAGRDEVEDSDGSTYNALVNRGLGGQMDAIAESVVPLFAGSQHVGMAFQQSGVIRTSCDVGAIPVKVGVERRSMVFEPIDGGLFEAKPQQPALSGPLVMRRPSFSEPVLVVGADATGPYYSSVKARVVHVGVSSKTFIIDAVDRGGALPLVGGLVVSTRDAAVLGVYVKHHASEILGETGSCVTLVTLARPVVAGPDTLVAALARACPVLHPAVWPQGLLERVFTESGGEDVSDFGMGLGNLPLAFIGASLLKVYLGTRMHESKEPFASWGSKFESVMSDSALFQVSSRLGLLDMMGCGVSCARPSKQRIGTDVVCALVAAVYTAETSGVYDRFMNGLLFYSPEGG